MFAAEVIIKMKFEVTLINIKPKFICTQRKFIAGNIIFITIIAGCNKAIEFIIEDMFPSYRKISVPVTVGGITVKVKPVLAIIACKVYRIFFVELVRNVEVEIIKRSFALFILIGQCIQQPVCIS